MRLRPRISCGEVSSIDPTSISQRGECSAAYGIISGIISKETLKMAVGSRLYQMGRVLK